MKYIPIGIKTEMYLGQEVNSKLERLVQVLLEQFSHAVRKDRVAVFVADVSCRTRVSRCLDLRKSALENRDKLTERHLD